MKSLYLCAILSILWLTDNAHGSEVVRSKAELVELQKKISQLQDDIEAERSTEKSLTEVLDTIEREASSLKQSLRQQRNSRQELENQIADLSANLQGLQQNNTHAIEKLARLFRSGYVMGKQSGLRLLVNQQDPDLSARRLTMFRYVMEARNRQILHLLEQTKEVRLAKQDLQERQQQLEAVIADLHKDKEQLVSVEQERKRELIKVQKILADSGEQIELYQQREQSLQLLIKRLSKRETKVVVSTEQKIDKPEARSNIAKVESESSSGVVKTPEVVTLAGFENNKGDLQRPIEASISARFGQKRKDSGLKWEGVLFESKEGQPVEVIYPGQVVFSDWFRGYGQLMVIDHGQGYMSLYGHNQNLHAGVGDTVSAGQVVAQAAAANMVSAPGLYFEIRYNGAPDDPLKWVR